MEETVTKEDLWCYRISPAPPKRDFQEYIVDYVKSRDPAFILQFLHYYEKTINIKVEGMMFRNFMPGHFSDLKQAYVMGLWKALEHYDISASVPFLVFKEYYVENEVLDYIRTARTGYTAPSLSEFKKLRKAMAIWTGKYHRKTDTATLTALAVEMGESLKNLIEILAGGVRNESAVALYHQYADDDSEKTIEEIIRAPNSDPAVIYFRTQRNTRLWAAFDDLEYEQQSMLAKHLGFCLNCHSTEFMDAYDLDAYGDPKRKPIPRMKYTDIATAHGYSSASTAKAKCSGALTKMRKEYVEP